MRHSTDPTHSMLSKDHFSNILNEPAGNVAAEILKFIAPRVLYAWEHPDVPVQQVMQDIEGIFHHPAIRNEKNECHRNMFNAVKKWLDSSNRGQLEAALSSDAVREGKNHKAGVNPHVHKPTAGSNQANNSGGFLAGFTSFLPGQQQSSNQSSTSGGFGGFANLIPGQHQGGGNHGGSSNPLGMVGDVLGNFTGHQQRHGGGGGGGLNSMLSLADKLPIPGVQQFTKYSKFFPGGGARGLDDVGPGGLDVGGSTELHEAAAHADRYGGDVMSPSPGPLQAPLGTNTTDGKNQEAIITATTDSMSIKRRTRTLIRLRSSTAVAREKVILANADQTTLGDRSLEHDVMRT